MSERVAVSQSKRVSQSKQESACVCVCVLEREREREREERNESASSRIISFCVPPGRVTFFCANILIFPRTVSSFLSGQIIVLLRLSLYIYIKMGNICKGIENYARNVGNS